MTDDRIASLEREIAKLRAEVADVRDAFKFEVDSTTAYFKRICGWTTSISRDLTKVMYKVLPEYAETRVQLDNILGFDDSPDSKSKKS